MRATQRYIAVANAAIFGFALCVILYINLSGSSEDRTFAWHTVNYKSRSQTPVSNEGTPCPGLSASKEPALVVAHVASDGDVAWLDQFSRTYHRCMYNVDGSGSVKNGLPVPANRGHEAMAYLTFIIDNYDSIPDAGAVFVHGSRFAWHNDSPDYDNAALLAALNVSAALEPHGYHNLRCDWSASTCDRRDSPAQGSLETMIKAKLQPWDARAVSDTALVDALVALFGKGIKEDVHPGRTSTIRSQCCAQFVVSRARLHQHSREEYVALRQWLLDGSNASGRLNNAAHPDDRVAGRVVSYMWHILFMGNENGSINLNELNGKACPTAAECYCRLYGRCNLSPCTPGRCHGQYAIPPGFTLPAPPP